MKSKNQIAQKIYGLDHCDLEAGEKASVTKKYNAQSRASPTATPTAPAVPRGSLTATIGRVGVNGTKTCILPKGATVKDFVTQSGFHVNDSKEGVMLEATGETVLYTALVIDKAVYAVAVGIKSN